MKYLITITALILLTGNAHAACFGGEHFKSCTDNAGNHYTVNKFGNTTQLNGRNMQGGTWRQDSTTLGNTTYHNGRAADGGNWNVQDTNIGNTRIITGRDSNGNSVNTVCGPYGCY